jgi:hypothetical protein
MPVFGWFSGSNPVRGPINKNSVVLSANLLGAADVRWWYLKRYA